MGQRGTKVSPMTVGEVYEHHLSTPPKPSTNMTVQHPQPQRGKCGHAAGAVGKVWACCGLGAGAVGKVWGNLNMHMQENCTC
ncbi:hypothetical protein QQF64_022527 [Cirrhinus molitorella]|uniref:Uncharacterized protein n=1 Tax=Cirrhinus molitorella TaxID=172907 RepID=A0ABR3L538_9TELE